MSVSEKIDKEYLDVRVDRYGYQLTYKGEQIGGESSERGRKIEPKRAVANARQYHRMATGELDKLVAGQGEPRFYRAIEAIRKRDADQPGQKTLFGGQ